MVILVGLVCVLLAQCTAAPPNAIGAAPERTDLNSMPQRGPRRQYYVATNGNDSNPGNTSRPWRTLTHAGAAVKPGAVVHVGPGEYAGPVKTVASGTADARILYISDKPWGAKLTSNATGNSATWHNKGDFVDIQNFDISGAGAVGIYNYGSNTRIVGNHVHDIKAPGCPAMGGAGILNGNYAGADNDVIGNVVHDVGELTLLCARVHGIYGTQRGGHIYNNLVFRNEGWGIHLYHAATQVTISNNTVFNNSYGGIVVGASSSDFPSGSGVNTDTYVTNNIVYSNGTISGASGYGIEEYGSSIGANYYQSNLVYQNRPADWKLSSRAVASGSIHSDPKFVRYSGDASGDYHLSPGSPARLAGTSKMAPAEDIQGVPRRAKIDLGAYQESDAAPRS